jgi:2'-5' RNA ligase
MLRLFFATDVPEQIVERVRALQDQLYDESAYRLSFVHPQKLHITLAFLGDQPDQKVPELCSLLRFLGKETYPLKVRIGTIHTVTRASYTVWLEVFSQDIDQLAHTIREQLGDSAAIGRHFRAHCTIAYIKQVKSLDLLNERIAAINCTYHAFDCLIDRISLKQSIQANYIDLCSIELQK